MTRGKFIVFGGCEGSGKSTQMKRLRELYPNAVFTREPGGSRYAEAIRETMLKAPGAKEAGGFSHLTLAFASCYDSFQNVVAPALAQGKTVFSDRSAILCSLAYEVFGYEKPELEKLFGVLRDYTTEVAKPDLYIILDVDTEVGMRRAADRKRGEGVTNHFDERGKDFHNRVRQGYLGFARNNPEKTKLIDADKNPDEIFTEIKKVLTPLLS